MTDTGWIEEHRRSFTRQVGAFKFAVYQRRAQWHVFISCLPIHFTKSLNYKYENSSKRVCENLIEKLQTAENLILAPERNHNVTKNNS